MIESAARRLASELVDRRESINRELSRNGVRFGIYKNGEYHDRLFPYDPIPRIIESDEFDRMEAGLTSRPSRTASCRKNTCTRPRDTFRKSTA